ncbi:uncharacterized protein LOC127049844 [Gopherus flavomarginatus]|uniref:uncharacterized protein LOC127049844 n=1 Tax=Gopherus flavomarginatus TaxID=286002 RepID=UPI0021CBF3DA|nr:uncharacterized protein LOC127049844 [Gopherus flavomarginatus]
MQGRVLPITSHACPVCRAAGTYPVPIKTYPLLTALPGRSPGHGSALGVGGKSSTCSSESSPPLPLAPAEASSVLQLCSSSPGAGHMEPQSGPLGNIPRPQSNVCGGGENIMLNPHAPGGQRPQYKLSVAHMPPPIRQRPQLRVLPEPPLCQGLAIGPAPALSYCSCLFLSLALKASQQALPQLQCSSMLGPYGLWEGIVPLHTSAWPRRDWSPATGRCCCWREAVPGLPRHTAPALLRRQWCQSLCREPFPRGNVLLQPTLITSSALNPGRVLPPYPMAGMATFCSLLCPPMTASDTAMAVSSDALLGWVAGHLGSRG